MTARGGIERPHRVVVDRELVTVSSEQRPFIRAHCLHCSWSDLAALTLHPDELQHRVDVLASRARLHDAAADRSPGGVS